MKKTVLGIITVVMLLLVMLSTSVNAATVSTDKTTMKKGDIVTVTVTTETGTESMQFELKYDATKYKFIENSVTSDLKMKDYNHEGNTVIVSAFDTSVKAKTLSLQFEALENGEDIAFVLSDEEFSNGETLKNTTVKVTIEEPAKPVEPEQPTEPEQPVEPEQPSEDVREPEKDNNNDYVDEDGNKITSIPQAGSLLPSILLGIAILAVVTFAGYKIIKK